MKKHLSLVVLLTLISLPSLSLANYEDGAYLTKVPVSSDISIERNTDIAEWTILVYMNGDNNLHEAALNDIEEMEAVGSTKAVNILVQFDGRERSDSRRLYVAKGDSVVVDDFSDTNGEVDMGQWTNLVDFILWGIDNYPAKKYFVDVWNHGNGALNSAKFKNMARAISFDETSGTFINTPELGLTFATIENQLGRNVDVYGSDACLMAMIEVAYEMKDHVDVIVGSQALEPGDGWPYDVLFTMLTESPQIDGKDLSKSLVEFYANSYSPGGTQGRGDVTLSAVSSERIGEFVDQMNKFIPILKDLYDYAPDIVERAASEAVFYEYDSHRDLGGFLESLKAQVAGNMGFADPLRVVIGLYYNSILNSASTGKTYADSTGLAIWFPQTSDTFYYNKNEYVTLKFGKDSLWFDFLEKYNRARADALAMN